ncbi:MAG TPA: class I adenylate-forming enzyme family protein [Chthoniobacterales bacterium]
MATPTQAQPAGFRAAWAGVLSARRAAAAIFDPQGATLRTYDDVEGERASWREALNGLDRGSGVVATLGNDPGWPALFLASLDLGLVLTPLEAGLPEQQQKQAFELTRASAWVRGLRAVEALKVKRAAWPEPVPDLLKLTSGTTGTPRAVRCRERHLYADCRNVCTTMGITPEDVNFGVISFSHSYGFSNLVTPVLYQGTRLVCAVDRLPRALHGQLQASGSTVFPGTPALFQALAGLNGVNCLGRVRLCLSAGAPLPQETKQRFVARYGLNIHSFYGSSECGGIAYDRAGGQDQPAGFVGAPLEGVDVRLDASDRLEVFGANVADGYFPAEDPEVLDGRCFRPGDLVRQTPAGLQLYGRVSDFVNIAGKKVHPSVIEECLRACPGVVDALVFGVPSPTRNEDLIACVVAGPAVTRASLEAHCRAGLSRWQVPRDFLLVAELPVDQRGKLNRAALARKYVERDLGEPAVEGQGDRPGPSQARPCVPES